MFLMLMFEGQADWKQEIFKRIDALAEKLGIAAAHLWGVLVRQGLAEALAGLVIFLAMFVLMVLVGKIVCAAWKKGTAFSEENKGDRYSTRDWPPRILLPVLLGSIAWCVSLIVALCNLYYAVMYFVNPEYFALQKLLELFR